MSEFESEAADAPEPQGTDDTPVLEADAPADTPAETAAAPDYASDPAFLDAVDARAAAMVTQRLAAQQQPPPVPQGDPVDWREKLNPLSDDYDPEAFYQARDEYLLGQVKNLLAPVIQREQQAQADQGKQLMEQFIGDRWDPADGELTADHKTAIQDLAPSYLAEMNQRYGEGPLAAQQALIKATDVIRRINKQAAGSGAQANIDRLHAVTSVPGEPGGAAAARNVMPRATSVDELLNNFFTNAA